MDLERKLVTLRTVGEILPIPNADNIELAVIDGWQCVVKKGEFKAGDKGIYFEIDSFIPLSNSGGTNEVVFDFLKKDAITWRGMLGARIRTIKLRGQISQGLLLPLSTLGPVTLNEILKDDDEDSQSEILAWYFDVEKWEREVLSPEVRYDSWLDSIIRFFTPKKYRPAVFKFIYGVMLPPKRPHASSFPSFIPKTDEERIQNIINKKLGCQDIYETTIKLNGSSMTVFVKNGTFGFCSRNVKLGLEDGSKFAQIIKRYEMNECLPVLIGNKNIAIQGELCGPGIQANYEKLDDLEFFVFRIWDIDEQRYHSPEEKDAYLEYLKGRGLHLHKAPVIGRIPLDIFESIDEFLKYAEGRSINAGKREGVVFQRIDGKDSFKVISNSYLLKGGD